MMIAGRIWKDGNWWIAESEIRGDATLEVFPDASADVESWRFLPPNDAAHFVVVGCQIAD